MRGLEEGWCFDRFSLIGSYSLVSLGDDCGHENVDTQSACMPPSAYRWPQPPYAACRTAPYRY